MLSESATVTLILLHLSNS